MIHPADDPPDREDTFSVECPNCGECFGWYSSDLLESASRSCSCGTVFRIDVDGQQAGAIIA
jgi:hypothetical protein